jgi:hypothetical protein
MPVTIALNHTVQQLRTRSNINLLRNIIGSLHQHFQNWEQLPPSRIVKNFPEAIEKTGYNQKI